MHLLARPGTRWVVATLFLLTFPGAQSRAQPNPASVVSLRAVNLVAQEPATPDGRGTPAEFLIEVWPPAAVSTSVSFRHSITPLSASPAGAAGAAGRAGGPVLHTTSVAPRWVLEGLWPEPNSAMLLAYLPEGATAVPVRVWLPYDETPRADQQLEFLLQPGGLRYIVGEASAVTVTLRETPPNNLSARATLAVAAGTVAHGEPLVFSGTAWDPDGVVLRLDFYDFTNHVGGLVMPTHRPGTTNAFAWRWADPPPGTGQLTVIPTDGAGQRGVPASIGFAVLPELVLEIEPPDSHGVPAAITLRARTRPESAGLTSVTFVAGDQSRQVSGPPFTTTLTLTNAGVYAIRANGLWNRRTIESAHHQLSLVADPETTAVVELVAVNGDITEGGAEAVLSFRRRGGDLGAPLAVPVRTATPPDHQIPPPRRLRPQRISAADLQTPLPAEVVFPADEAEVVWRLAAVEDGLAEGNEGLLVQLMSPSSAAAGYAPGPSRSALLLVRDNDVPVAGQVTLGLDQDAARVSPTRPLVVNAGFSGGTAVREGLLTLDGWPLAGRNRWELRPEQLFPGPHVVKVELMDEWMRTGRAALEFHLAPEIQVRPGPAPDVGDGRRALTFTAHPPYPHPYRWELSDDLLHWRPAGEAVLDHPDGASVRFDPTTATAGFVRAVSDYLAPGSPPR